MYTITTSVQILNEHSYCYFLLLPFLFFSSFVITLSLHSSLYYTYIFLYMLERTPPSRNVRIPICVQMPKNTQHPPTGNPKTLIPYNLCVDSALCLHFSLCWHQLCWHPLLTPHPRVSTSSFVTTPKSKYFPYCHTSPMSIKKGRLPRWQSPFRIRAVVDRSSLS